MKIRQQMASAVAAIALLGAASAAVLISGSSNSSLAASISAEALSAMTTALGSPGAALSEQLRTMDQQQAGSQAAFLRAFSSARDTEAVSSALNTLASGNLALQAAIEGALTNLAADPRISAVAQATSRPDQLPATAVVATVKTEFVAKVALADKSQQQTSDAAAQELQQELPPSLGNLEPAAGGNGFGAMPRIHAPAGALSAGLGGGGSPIGQPVSQSPNTVTPPVVTTPPSPGRPNSRS